MQSLYLGGSVMGGLLGSSHIGLSHHNYYDDAWQGIQPAYEGALSQQFQDRFDADEMAELRGLIAERVKERRAKRQAAWAENHRAQAAAERHMWLEYSRTTLPKEFESLKTRLAAAIEKHKRA